MLQKTHHQNRISTQLYGVCVSLFLVMCAPFPAIATTGLPVTPADLTTATCDTTYFESMKSRAWLEGQRRSRQTQNYILKPDSVLDYSCFDILSNYSALHTEEIFSESHAGQCFPDSLDCSLEGLVISALTPYITENFNHSFLGGKSNLSRAAYDPNNTEMCTVMRDVWALAKCHNFMLEADVDGFLSFSDYAGTDPRLLPVSCTNPANVAADWDDNIENAFSPPDADSWYEEIHDASEENTQKYERYLFPGNSAPGCGNLIKTGIVINDINSIFYSYIPGWDDGICSNPACVPNYAGNCVVMNF